MTDNQIAAFDPNALKKRIAESVQSSFGMLIPQAQFDKMVADEVTAYFETETKMLLEDIVEERQSGWGSERVKVLYARMTPFRRQVWEAVSKQVSALIEKKLHGPELAAHISTVYGENGAVRHDAELSDVLTRKLEEIAPKMAASMFTSLFAEAVQHAKGSIMTEINQKLNR